MTASNMNIDKYLVTIPQEMIRHIIMVKLSNQH